MDDKQGQDPFDATPNSTGNNEPSNGENGGQKPSGFDLNYPTIISLLYLGSFVTGFTGFIGLVLAYVWKGEQQEPWATSHYEYMIRTFWIGLLGFVISSILFLVLIGFFLMFAVAIWIGVRSVMSLINAQKHQPMPNPKTWLI